MTEVFIHTKLVVVIHAQEHIEASSVVRRHASDFESGVGDFRRGYRVLEYGR